MSEKKFLAVCFLVWVVIVIVMLSKAIHTAITGGFA